MGGREKPLGVQTTCISDDDRSLFLFVFVFFFYFAFINFFFCQFFCHFLAFHPGAGLVRHPEVSASIISYFQRKGACVEPLKCF